MEITNAQLARDFVEAWKPHASAARMFRAALRGLRIARSIAQGRVYSDETRRNYDDAIKVLLLALFNRNEIACPCCGIPEDLEINGAGALRNLAFRCVGDGTEMSASDALASILS